MTSQIVQPMVTKASGKSGLERGKRTTLLSNPGNEKGVSEAIGRLERVGDVSLSRNVKLNQLFR